ncbi:MAG: ABC transporter ATP-binding protein [Candidatus Tectomicrobia bacterium]|nr:ABC transporter ATP-binding protein [Candidatus Tectomicrobia bacterium]
MPTKLEIKDLCKGFTSLRSEQSLPVFSGLELRVAENEFICIVGPSGCGKTTFLRILDGLIPFDSGEILLDGQRVIKPGIDKGFVFQDSSLLPWRTVVDNIILGLELHGTPRREARARARHYVELVGLRGFENHYPYELSGGMQQRVNLARALIIEPQVLLMDEPFASLDAQTREIMQLELLKTWGGTRKTVLFVTHQIEEAVYLADRVVVFSSRPATIKAEIPIELTRPRPLAVKRSPQFLAYIDRIWSMIEAEVRRSMLEQPGAEV